MNFFFQIFDPFSSQIEKKSMQFINRKSICILNNSFLAMLTARSSFSNLLNRIASEWTLRDILIHSLPLMDIQIALKKRKMNLWSLENHHWNRILSSVVFIRKIFFNLRHFFYSKTKSKENFKLSNF